MSGYPGGYPQYPAPQNQIYPQIYNPANAPPPTAMAQPAMPGFPTPNQPQYPYQPGFAYNGQQGFPGQPGYPGQPGQPGYPGQPGQPSHPANYSYAGIQPTPTVTPTAPAYGNAYPPPVEWVQSNAFTAQNLTDRAVVAGYEGYDHSPLWVIRAMFQGDVIPGKLAIKHRGAYVPWGGKENLVENFEVCCAIPERVRWIPSRSGAVPPNAVPAGNTAQGETLYVGRAKHQGSLTPGKVQPSHKNMYISFANEEIAHNDYEVLCTV